jgi:CspA family cold shock protein
VVQADHIDREDFSPAAIQPLPADDPVKARLKWFNAPKGFGFVVPDGENIDAFLHITTLQRANVLTLGEGAILLCHITRGPKGAHVTHVISLVHEGDLPEELAIMRDRLSQVVGDILRMHGHVKWYKPDKGFGFIVPEDGLKDVFVHKTCLERHGLEYLMTGQRVYMTLRAVPKGREVIKLEFPDEY